MSQVHPIAPTALHRPPPFRVGDHLALDFLNSLAAPRRAVIEWIADGRDLVEWLAGAGALGPDVAQRIAADALPAALDAVAADAVALREAWRDLVARIKAGGASAVTPADLAQLNAALARDAVVQRIDPAPDGERPRLLADRRWREPGALIGPLAAAMADLVCERDFALVRRCENPACTLWFYDRTKAHRRRWCSQAHCGNRAKAAAHRARHRRPRASAISSTALVGDGDPAHARA